MRNSKDGSLQISQQVSQQVSQSQKRKLWKFPVIILIALTLFSILLLCVWFTSNAVELAYEIDNLVKEKEVLEEENNELSLEIAKLKSPERINGFAREDLGMVKPLEAEVIILRK